MLQVPVLRVYLSYITSSSPTYIVYIFPMLKVPVPRMSCIIIIIIAVKPSICPIVPVQRLHISVLCYKSLSYVFYDTSPCPTCISVLCMTHVCVLCIYLFYECPCPTDKFVLCMSLSACLFVLCKISLSCTFLYNKNSKFKQMKKKEKNLNKLIKNILHELLNGTLLLRQVAIIVVAVNIYSNNIYISTILTIFNNKHNIIDQ